MSDVWQTAASILTSAEGCRPIICDWKRSPCSSLQDPPHLSRFTVVRVRVGKVGRAMHSPRFSLFNSLFKRQLALRTGRSIST